jgi:2-dehydro-3-deoxyphosphooctonate aldolase (KDO 8-P synthase)
MQIEHTVVDVSGIKVGRGHPLVLIAGPCVLEDREMAVEIARRIREITSRLSMPFIFKASYDKANRSSLASHRGPGVEEGLSILADVRERCGVPVLSDVHTVEEAGRAGEVLDVVQIPAFLCRQTDLVLAVGRTGKAVNVKKGQFLAPDDVHNVVEKVASTGNTKVMVTERGTVFGYHDLVADMRSVLRLRAAGYPVVFDATHSLQRPGGEGERSGGQPELIPGMARAAVAAGCDAIFLETHHNPIEALSDASSMLPLDELESVLRQAVVLGRAVREMGV